MKKLINTILLISILFSTFTVTHIANAENSSQYDYSSFIGSWYNEDFSWGTSYGSMLDEIEISSANNNYITLSIIERAEGTEVVSGTYQIIDNQISWIDSDYLGNQRPKHILTFNDDSIIYTENGSDKMLRFTSNVIKPRKITVDNYSVILNGQKLEFDQPPVMVNDRILVPFRVILEAMNADVYYDVNNDVNSNVIVISAVKNNTVVQISNSSLGWSLAKSNYDNEGYELLELDTYPIIINGRTLVPIRILAECFGADVSWDGKTGTVNITTDTSGKRKSAEEIRISDNFSVTTAHKIAEDLGLAVGGGPNAPYFDEIGKYFTFPVWDQERIDGGVRVYYNGKIACYDYNGKLMPYPINDTTYNYQNILNGNFSDFAGVWTNTNGDTINLLSNGTEGQTYIKPSDGKLYNQIAEDFYVNLKGEYKWSVKFNFTDEENDSYTIWLYPIGVDVIVNGVVADTDTSKVRLYAGQDFYSASEMSNKIFYKE